MADRAYKTSYGGSGNSHSGGKAAGNSHAGKKGFNTGGNTKVSSNGQTSWPSGMTNKGSRTKRVAPGNPHGDTY